MTHPDETAEPGVPLADAQLSTAFLKPDEARILLDWAHGEDQLAGDTAGTARVRAIVMEIDNLVGHRVELVADDLEERMIALLVGDLDPRSAINLEISRDVAQVTAEKDHLEGAELVRRLTQISSHTLRLRAGAPASAASGAAAAVTSTAAVPAPATPSPAVPPVVAQPTAARVRPIPRPTKYPPRKPSFVQRLLGRK